MRPFGNSGDESNACWLVNHADAAIIITRKACGDDAVSLFDGRGVVRAGAELRGAELFWH